MEAIVCSNSSKIGSIRCEWKACDTTSALDLTPLAVRVLSSASTLSLLPETTTLVGPLLAATTTPSIDSSSFWTFAIPVKTAAMDPPSGREPIRRARVVINFSPSSSEKTPAMQAATISPTLCPITASGTTPHDIHVFAKAYSVMKSRGCAYCVLLMTFSSSAAPPNNTDMASTSHKPLSVWIQSSMTDRKIGTVSYSSLHMPCFCDPCPVKRNAVLGGAWSSHSLKTTFLSVSSLTNFSSEARSSSSDFALTAMRTRWWLRPVLDVKHTSPRAWPDGRKFMYFLAYSFKLMAVRAESVNRCEGSSPSSDSFRGCAGGASDTTTCALVPENPNELTPPMRGLPLSGQGIVLVGMMAPARSRDKCGFSLLNPRWPGMVEFCTAKISSKSPDTPAAPSR